jgi:hypothetical protein
MVGGSGLDSAELVAGRPRITLVIEVKNRSHNL